MLSLETCLKLKEAGWQQLPFEYCWARFHNESEPTCIDSTKASDYLNTSSRIICACPSLEELLEAVIEETDMGFNLEWRNGEYRITDVHGNHEYYHAESTEAVAALWLKLKAGSE